MEGSSKNVNIVINVHNIHFFSLPPQKEYKSVLPYLGMVGRFCGDDPGLGIFNPIGSLFYTVAGTDKLSFSGNFLIYLNMLSFLFKYLYIVYLCELDNKLIYILNTIRLTHSFCRKNRFVSITFSSRDTRT